MAALAAVVNKAIADDKSIQLFFNTGKAQLGLAIQSGTSTDDQANDIWEPDDDDYNGYILNPSSIAAATYRGLNYVAAVTTPRLDPGATQTVNQISLVSPIYQKLSSTTLENTNVALCVTPDGNNGWLYHLSGESSSDRILKELDLKTLSTQNNTIQNVAPNASLAAFYHEDEGKRHVIYEGGGLLEYIVEDKQVFNIPSSTIPKNPAVAVAYSTATKKTYLYYNDQDLSVLRITKDQYGWAAAATPIAGAPKISEFSKMAVVQANGFNHLFYIPKDFGGAKIKATSDFQHIRDPIN
ncbi:hypothetical protein O1611_g3790 [Lasiodiplodia mahajangana]|uniref:Uncharacterized protein n=1 Tax=Lasiodiplodia mahajangana TaxID=1108764 RepID=A0ACC2JQQ3_9PEZI|nr:hypothetical protein O1611_g3790 [Lasiodiplodia mahajangana]